MVYTTSEFKTLIQSKCADLTGVQFFEKNFYKSMNQARISKLDIFDYTGIENYEKVIYIDADSIFIKDPLPIFDSIQDDIVYVYGEGNILCDAEYWGRSLFLKENPQYLDREGIASFIMGFKTVPAIKKMLIKTKQAFYLDMYQNKLKFYDQPFLNFSLSITICAILMFLKSLLESSKCRHRNSGWVICSSFCRLPWPRICKTRTT